MGFLGLGGRALDGPYSCHELVVFKQSAAVTVRLTFQPRCGLPYLEDETQLYNGPGPTVTVNRLRSVADAVAGLSALYAEQTMRSRLGLPIPNEDPPVWIGIGPRTHTAPFSCHELIPGSPSVAREAALDRWDSRGRCRRRGSILARRSRPSTSPH